MTMTKRERLIKLFSGNNDSGTIPLHINSVGLDAPTPTWLEVTVELVNETMPCQLHPGDEAYGHVVVHLTQDAPEGETDVNFSATIASSNWNETPQ